VTRMIRFCMNSTHHLGIAYTRLQHPDLAIAHYQAALQIAIPEAELELTITWATWEGTDLTGAKTAYEMALQIDPTCSRSLQPGLDIKGTGRGMQQQPSASNPVESNLCRAYQNLGVVLLKLGHVPESLAAFVGDHTSRAELR